MINSDQICARCGKHRETTPSEYAWDVFCNECFEKFQSRTLELLEIKEQLSGSSYDWLLRRIGWEFCLDPECVRAYIWSIEE